MELNMTALLLAIAAVESGNNASKVGNAGEVTQYQITPAVWKMYSKTPFNAKKAPWMARAVAVQHIRKINEILPPALRNRPQWIAVAWNGGMGAVNEAKVKGEYRYAHVPKGVQDYADRVRALYLVYSKQPEEILNKQ